MVEVEVLRRSALVVPLPSLIGMRILLQGARHLGLFRPVSLPSMSEAHFLLKLNRRRRTRPTLHAGRGARCASGWSMARPWSGIPRPRRPRKGARSTSEMLMLPDRAGLGAVPADAQRSTKQIRAVADALMAGMFSPISWRRLSKPWRRRGESARSGLLRGHTTRKPIAHTQGPSARARRSAFFARRNQGPLALDDEAHRTWRFSSTFAVRYLQLRDGAQARAARNSWPQHWPGRAPHSDEPRTRRCPSGLSRSVNFMASPVVRGGGV